MTGMDHRSFLAAVPRADRALLTRRSDRAGLWHLAGHLGLIVLVGAMIAGQVPFWPLLLPVQGVLIVFLFTLQHECTHQTPFANTRLNDAVGHLCGVLILLPFVWFRYFHLAHHRWTNLPGQDPELEGGAITTRSEWLWQVSGLPYWWAMARTTLRLVWNREDPTWLPDQARPRAVREARVLVSLYALVLISLPFAPVLLWVWLVPVVLGQPALRLYLLAEHGDCPTVANMLANTRTTYTTAIVRFLAWNMPYHTEHHVWPAVPFHQLPALHDRMQAHLQVTADGYAAFTRGYLARRAPLRAQGGSGKAQDRPHHGDSP